MTVHIIIPTHNPDDSLARAVEAALAQTHQDILVTVIDDCSDVAVLPVIKRFSTDDRLRYIRLAKNSGPSTARNIGLLLSGKADYVSFHDDDDVPAPDKITLQLHALHEIRHIDTVRRRTIDQAGKDAYEVAVSRVLRREVDGTSHESGSMIYLLRDIYPNVYPHFGVSGRKDSVHIVSSLFDKAVFQRLGGFYAGLYHYEDNELAARLVLSGTSFTFVEQALYNFNKSAGSLTYNADGSQGQTELIFERIAAMKTDSTQLTAQDFAATYRQPIAADTSIGETHNLRLADIDLSMPASPELIDFLVKATA